MSLGYFWLACFGLETIFALLGCLPIFAGANFLTGLHEQLNIHNFHSYKHKTDIHVALRETSTNSAKLRACLVLRLEFLFSSKRLLTHSLNTQTLTRTSSCSCISCNCYSLIDFSQLTQQLLNQGSARSWIMNWVRTRTLNSQLIKKQKKADAFSKLTRIIFFWHFVVVHSSDSLLPWSKIVTH